MTVELSIIKFYQLPNGQNFWMEMRGLKVNRKVFPPETTVTSWSPPFIKVYKINRTFMIIALNYALFPKSTKWESMICVWNEV